MKTSMVILTYNQLEYTKLCIDSIREFTKPGSYEIIIVDNFSTDGTREWLKEQKDIRVIMNERNLGFPKGCNQGIEIATGDFILLLNNDTVVTANWLDNMIKCLNSSPEIGAVGCLTNNCSYGQQISVPYLNSDLNEMQKFAANFNYSNEELWEERLKLVGFCYLFKKELVERIGFLDEIFTPGNYEDDDYSLRIREAGYKLILCRDTFIHHFGSVSFKQNTDRFKDLLSSNRRKFMNIWGFDPDAQRINFGVVDQLREVFSEQAEIHILEIGCQCGGNLLKIKNDFPHSQLYGLEKNKSAAEIAGYIGNVKHVSDYYTELDYPDACFDAIVIDEILCEIADPWGLIDGLQKYLKPSGKFIIGVFNVMHFSIIGELLNGSWDYEGDSILDKRHLRFFTLNEIKKMLVRSGLEITNTLGIPFHYTDYNSIENLSKFLKPELINQLNIAEFIVTAQKSELPVILQDLYNNKEVSNITYSEIERYDDKTIMDFIEYSQPRANRFELYNSIGVIFFENLQLKRVLPYFERALEINENDKEVLFNTAYFLTYLGESGLSEDYAAKLREVDIELFYHFMKITNGSLIEYCSNLEHSPLVSIVIRTKNRPGLLKRCLESLTSQFYSNLEVVIVNDGGIEIDDVLQTINYPIQYLHHEFSRGRAAALKIGLDHAKGDYVNFLDDDDLLYPNHVASLVQALLSSQKKVVYSDSLLRIERKEGEVWKAIEKKKEYSRDFDAELLRRTNFMPNLTVMFSKELSTAAGGINEKYHVLEDWDFWIRLSGYTDFYHLDMVTCEYSQRINGDNATQLEGHTFGEIRNMIYREQGIID
ncbi:glycosyltransferase [Paenibacillus favisporus]|uniref:glycosyltransferase n=1 Tax=Paenibacillus favisporus TaxID=221028 RepID=UPI003D2902F0